MLANAPNDQAEAKPLDPGPCPPSPGNTAGCQGPKGVEHVSPKNERTRAKAANINEILWEPVNYTESTNSVKMK